MAFTSIPSNWYAVGKALKRQLFSRISEDLDDLNNRVTALSLGASPVDVFDEDVFNASSASSLTGLIYFQAKTNFTLTGAEVQIFEKGPISSGFVTIDVLKSATLGGTYSSVFTVSPTVNFSTASDYAKGVGTFDPLAQSVLQGEYLRLDVTALPTTTLGKFRVFVYGAV